MRKILVIFLCLSSFFFNCNSEAAQYNSWFVDWSPPGEGNLYSSGSTQWIGFQGSLLFKRIKSERERLQYLSNTYAKLYSIKYGAKDYAHLRFRYFEESRVAIGWMEGDFKGLERLLGILKNREVDNLLTSSPLHPNRSRSKIMKAIWNDKVIAETSDALFFDNNQYFPPESLKKEFFKASANTSVCPWKGTASYYDVVVDGKTNAGAAWYYASPKAEAAEIKGRVAFWKGVRLT